jgi:hypothetical protein
MCLEEEETKSLHAGAFMVGSAKTIQTSHEATTVAAAVEVL